MEAPQTRKRGEQGSLQSLDVRRLIEDARKAIERADDEDQTSGKTTCGHRKYPGIPLLVSRAVVSSPRDPLIDIR